MEERGVKTIICSVLFLDIVEYSKKSVSGQIALKEGFNAFLLIAIGDVPVDDRIILDTGDGAVISFLGDVEDALKAALIMRESLLNSGAFMDPPLLVRMGVNLGPVRLVKDINGLPNIVGDGINVAQRVMAFSAPGQILVSQSYYDAVSRLSQEYAGMFHYQGARTDKHVREHEVYAIGYPGEFVVMHKNPVRSNERFTLDAALATVKSWGPMLQSWFYYLNTAYQNASIPLRALAIALLIIFPVLVILGIKKLTSDPAPVAIPVPIVAERVKQNEALPQSSVLNSPVLSAASALPAVPAIKSTSQVADATATEQLKDKPKKIRVKNARVRTVEETTAINTAVPAVVSLAVTPWGEIYLDGRIQGVSPPLAELQVVPGEHEIEIRNSTFPVYRKKFTVQANGKIKIKHKFGIN